MRDRRYVEDLTIEELEELLLTRRREERLARMRRMGIPDRVNRSTLAGDSPFSENSLGGSKQMQDAGLSRQGARKHGILQVWRERILLLVEGAALVGLVAVVISLVVSVRNLNQEWKQQNVSAAPSPTPTSLIRPSILPGGHRPPTVRGGEGQPLVEALPLALPTPGPHAPTRLVIPSIYVDVNVVEGDDWEQLKKGAGHRIGTANPGERGNCFISGHNDVYGEIFRKLEDIQVNDEIIVYAGDQPYRYIVRAPPRIVEPDNVSVMFPTTNPVLTLLTCHPYMVDTHRLIVIAELDE